ncbi:MAG: hypothetical protein HGA44_06480 [Cellulomonadaceae bacterium]|nr:hypothetical protein [Cellulomonadaceae bacterium]
MAKPTDNEIVTRFVLRARRIEAHSLVQDWDQLTSHAAGSIQLQLDVEGKASITRRLPDDEERFESLAARLRPLTVASEPVHYEKVVEALERLIDGAEVPEAARDALGQLRAAWIASELQGDQTQGYALQMITLDGSEATPLVSDTQMAAGWLYSDLVHADPTGPKREALAFPLRERYAAAVRLFSHLAVLTVRTLRLIERLRDLGALTIEPAAWDEAVVVEVSELTEESEVYLSEVGTQLPGADERFELGSEWTRVTVTEMLRQDRTKQVQVVLEGEDGTALATYDAAVAHRSLNDTTASWYALVAGSVMFRFEWDRDGEHLGEPRFLGCELHESTNQLRAASYQLLLEMHCSTRMRFSVLEQDIFVLGTPTLTSERVRELEVMQQTVGDILAIEQLSGTAVDVCAEGFDDRDRARLRRARLMWEGRVVQALRHPVEVTSPNGALPQVVQVASGELNVGGARVPTLTWVMWHPAMTAIAIGPAPEAGPDAQRFKVQVPDGEHFLAWAPERVSPAVDQSLTPTASWDLIGIDEETSGF